MKKRRFILWKIAVISVFCSAVPCDAEKTDVLPGMEFSFWNYEETAENKSEEELKQEEEEMPRQETDSGSSEGPDQKGTQEKDAGGLISENPGKGTDESAVENSGKGTDESAVENPGKGTDESAAENPGKGTADETREGGNSENTPVRTENAASEEEPVKNGVAAPEAGRYGTDAADTGEKTSADEPGTKAWNGASQTEARGNVPVNSRLSVREEENGSVSEHCRPSMPCSRIGRPEEAYGNPLQGGQDTSIPLFQIAAEEDLYGIHFSPYEHTIPVMQKNTSKELIVLSCQINGREASHVWKGSCLMINGKAIRNGENRIRIQCQDLDGIIYQSSTLTFQKKTEEEEKTERSERPLAWFHKFRILIETLQRKLFSESE